MSNPFIDFDSMTAEQLLEKNKEYTMQMQKINGNSPLYQQVLDLQTQCQMAYNEKMFMSLQKEKLKEPEKIIEIGEIKSDEYSPDYDDVGDKLAKTVANLYRRKDGNDGTGS
tara:strand:- start:33397 stop:33732 length:336 start_codon:yes stop_codon:yes gene_type:complete